MSSASSLSSSPPPANSAPSRRPFRGPAPRSRRQNVDYGVHNSFAQLNRRELHGMDIYRWEDDDLSLRSAATQARLPYDRMTLQEVELFPEFIRHQASSALFLYIRNKMLVHWQLEPLVELTLDSFLRELPEPFNSDIEMVSGIHAYLQRHGFINFGHFHVLSNRRLDQPIRVIVIGAGAAGLAAARHLNFLGFNVLVLEGRGRVGGRVFTFRQKQKGQPPGPPADLGGQIITGIVGNPLVTLVKQMPATVVRIKQKCPIYDSTGKLVDLKKDDMIQRSFNKILDTISYIVHRLGVTEVDEPNGQKRKFSLGEAFELLLNQQELRVQKRRLNYWRKYDELLDKLEWAKKKRKVAKNGLERSLAQLRRNGVNPGEAGPESVRINYEERADQREFERQLTVRCLRKCVQMAVETYEEADNDCRDFEQILSEYKNMEPSHVYMNNVDKRVLDFHLANLEYAIGAPLNSVSAKDWDQDDPYAFAGSHMTVKEGLGVLMDKLASGLEIRRNHTVERIQWARDGVQVTFSTPSSQHQGQQATPLRRETVKADAVLCTVPLGVLKRSVFVNPEDGNGAICFEPPLPAWKREAISRLGFGSLNRIVLFFDKPFWDTNKSSFGRLNDTTSARGELFLFFTNGDLPILTGLFAGDAASITNRLDQEIIMCKAMDILHRIFGANCPQKPKYFLITRWHQDKYALGCYSYMTVKASPQDYDALARPLRPLADEKCEGKQAAAPVDQSATAADCPLPRVFFAGEHTNRQYPASVHGALLSGLREAGHIADTFIGPLEGGGEQLSQGWEDRMTIAGEEKDGKQQEEDGNKPGTSGSRQVVQQQKSSNPPRKFPKKNVPIFAEGARRRNSDGNGVAGRLSGQQQQAQKRKAEEQHDSDIETLSS